MMMKMLDATALPIMTDHERTDDEDNPKGYFEYERVEDLHDETDKSWVREARGRVLKVIPSPAAKPSGRELLPRHPDAPRFRRNHCVTEQDAGPPRRGKLDCRRRGQ